MSNARLAAVRLASEAAPELPHLVSLQPSVQPSTCVLGEQEYAIGRGDGCDIVVPFRIVSRLHAQLEQVNGRFQLRDLGSKNGTYVNGVRLFDPHELTNYDVIGLGEAGPHLTFVDPDMTQMRSSGLQYDERTMRFTINAAVLDLTPNQFRLLRCLYRNAGGVCSREQLACAVWGEDYAPGMDATTLDRLISTLRGAIRRAGACAEIVVTRPGLGYQLDAL
jgi:DNA-binding response OmpR family regulator